MKRESRKRNGQADRRKTERSRRRAPGSERTGASPRLIMIGLVGLVLVSCAISSVFRDRRRRFSGAAKQRAVRKHFRPVLDSCLNLFESVTWGEIAKLGEPTDSDVGRILLVENGWADSSQVSAEKAVKLALRKFAIPHCFFKLPAAMRAEEKSEVETLVVLVSLEKRIGVYVDPQAASKPLWKREANIAATQETLHLLFVDVNSRRVVGLKTMVAKEVPKSISSDNLYAAESRIDNERILAYLKRFD